MLRPWQQGFPQGEHQMTIILGAVRPMLAISKAIHSYLIEARGGKVICTFKPLLPHRGQRGEGYMYY